MSQRDSGYERKQRDLRRGPGAMSQRNSGYDRMPRDEYSTPAWVTLALIPHLPSYINSILEPACGSGKMVATFHEGGFNVLGHDIDSGFDFLVRRETSVDAIITNPPYNLATEFICHALNLMCPRGMVAMLLRTDFDHARTRRHLFEECEQFAKKVVLTKRIKWFEDSEGSPSFNHAWFIWDWKHNGPPTLAYGP